MENLIKENDYLKKENEILKKRNSELSHQVSNLTKNTSLNRVSNDAFLQMKNKLKKIHEMTR